jgi:NAD-dependent DNA ligase
MANKVLDLNLVDELIYHSYAYNRKRSPEIPDNEWALIFPKVTELEKRYQEENDRETQV